VVDYRNPNLADAMHVLGFVQRFGIGIQLARRELERNRNPALEFDANASNVLATVRPAS
jgi:ATP-dependent DNA helicase RecG